MESVDAERSVQAASDELHVGHLCDPCNYEENEKAAINVCQECKEYLCKDCTDSHRKVTVTRNHRILSVEQVLGRASVFNTTCKILCENCKSEEVMAFCEQHHIVICKACKTVQHRKCKSVLIEEKGKSYNKMQLGQTAEKIRAMVDELDKHLEDTNTALQALKTSKESCLTEMRLFREEINRFLETLEEKNMKESDKKESRERHDIELHLSTVSTTLQMLKTESRLLEDAQKNAIDYNMFAADIKVSNNLREYGKLLQDIYKESKTPVITFKRNELLNNIKNETNEFGTVAVNYVQDRTVPQKLFPDMSVQSSSQVDVKAKDDRATPDISACDVLPDEQIVLCDYNNYKVKLLHSSFTLKETLALQSGPWDVSVINNSSVIVTLPWSKQLQYIELEPSLKCGRVVQLDKICWGVQVVGESLYITLHNNHGPGEVRILGLRGDLKKTIGVNQDGSCMFILPYYLTVSSTLERIYTSDAATDTVTCIKPDGSVVYKYQDSNLKCPRGFCVDAMENLIVCDEASNNVQIITASSKMSRILLTAKKPQSVTYRQTDNTLIIGCLKSNYLLVYYLT